jgi:WD40 repeat protein/serine/threonine protein kinase/tetratricopeptide (TPR) repeat protein
VSDQACPSAEELSGFLLGTLPEADLERIVQHLDGCPTCEAAVKALENVSDPVLAAIRHAPFGESSKPQTPNPKLELGGLDLELTAAGGRRLGDFRIVREVGRGGMGVVYEAEQVSLGRRVALKVLPRRALLDPEAVERFRRESRAAAGLHHTNIVQVFGTGEQDGLHYFVMQFIPGVGLDVLIQELKQLQPRRHPSVTKDVSRAASAQELLSGHLADPKVAALVETPTETTALPLPAGASPAGADSAKAAASSAGSGRTYWVSVARIGAQVADALAFAHAHGVVHRDIKPSNLLLDPRGTVWVSDFGLAKAAADPENLTHSGDVLGTLRYMAPERFLGKSDARSDVYSLGVTLYELLTFRSPFTVADRNQLLHQVVHEEPPRPRKVNPEVPRDLETIVLKVIAKEPAHRYQTAADFADDLRRFVEDRPVLARRLTPPERLWRWCRRDPRTAALLAALLLALVTGLAGVATQWRRAESNFRAEADAHKQEADARRQAERAEGEARDGLYQSGIAQARLEWRLNNFTGAEQVLDACEPGRRGWEWRYLRGVNRQELFTRPADVVQLFSVAFSPDGRLLACTGWDPYRKSKTPPNTVEVWDLHTGQQVQALTGPGAGMRVTFSPDGKLLAASGPTGPAQLWDVAKGTLVRAWAEGGPASFSRDGKRLAMSLNGALLVADVATGREVHRFPAPRGRVAFRPDGRVLAVSGPRDVRLLDVATGHENAVLPYGPTEVDAYWGGEGIESAFSPDGKLLVTATSPPQVWDVTADPPRLRHRLVGHAGTVPGVAFSPDGQQIATAGADGTVRLWDAHSGAERSVHRGHRGWASCVAFHPDGWCLASGGRQPGDIRLWDLTRPPEHLALDRAHAQALAFDSADGRLQLLSIVGRLESWDPSRDDRREGARIDTLNIRVGNQWVTPACIAAYSADGRLLAGVRSDTRSVAVWEVHGGREVATLGAFTAQAVYVAMSPDGRRVAAVDWPHGPPGQPRAVRVWDVATKEVLFESRPVLGPGPYAHGAVALSPDGARLAFDDYVAPAAGEALRARVRVCDVASGRELVTLEGGDANIQCLAFSPKDGRLAAAGDQAGRLVIWDTTTGRRLHADGLVGQWYRLAFSPDGRRLAAVDRQQVKVWDVASGKEVLTLRGLPPRPTDGGFNPTLAWSPDGRWLAATNYEGGVDVWDGADRPEPAAEAPPAAVPAAWRYAWHLDQAWAALQNEQPAAAAFHLARVREVGPPDLDCRLRRGRLFLRHGDSEQAAADLSAVFADYLPDEPGTWVDCARALLLRGDTEGYHRLCARLRAPGVEQAAPDALPHVLWACVLAPGAVADPASLVRPAAMWQKAEPQEVGFRFVLGLAHYRAGEWEQARQRLQEAADADPPHAWLYWPALALAEQRLGHAAQARRWLDRATEWRRQETRRIGESAGFAPEGAWPDFLILDAEADARINGGKP